MSKPETLTSASAIVRFDIMHWSDADLARLIHDELNLTTRQYVRSLTQALLDPSVVNEYPCETRRIRHRLTIAASVGGRPAPTR